MIEKIDFGENIKEVRIDFNLSEEITIDKQAYELKEDLIQIIYNNGYILDVGWYPEFDINGSFKTVIIRNYDWDKPIFSKTCNNLSSLHQQIIECVEIIKNKKRDYYTDNYFIEEI